MKNKLIFILALLFCDMARAENSVVFEAVGSPGFLTIEGKGAKIKGAIELKDGKASGTYTVDLNSFDTGDSLRNKHLKQKYLETDKYPIAKLTLNPVVLPKQGYFNWSGELTLHGVTDKVSGVGFIEGKQIECKFTIDTEAFKIKKATYAGVGVDSKISIVARLDGPS